MYTNLKSLRILIDINVNRLIYKVDNGIVDKYFVECMEHYLDGLLKNLKNISSDAALISKYTNKIFSAIDYANNII